MATPFPKPLALEFTLSECAALASGTAEKSSQDWKDWRKHFTEKLKSGELPSRRESKVWFGLPPVPGMKVNSLNYEETIIAANDLRQYLLDSGMAKSVDPAMLNVLDMAAASQTATANPRHIAKAAFVDKHWGKGGRVANFFNNRPEQVRKCAIKGRRGWYSEECLREVLDAHGVPLSPARLVSVPAENFGSGKTRAA